MTTNFFSPENAGFYSANIYRPLRKNAAEIRLLSLLPGSLSDPIRCKLIHKVFLSKYIPSYEVLSYCAGDYRDTIAVEVEGQPFHAFKTLEAPLRTLRSQTHSRPLWMIRSVSTRATPKKKAIKFSNAKSLSVCGTSSGLAQCLVLRGRQRPILWLDQSRLGMGFTEEALGSGT
jgi:hypothetical protein